MCNEKSKPELYKVYAEYGDVGTEFDYITPSGFGWMNASYQYGLSLLNKTLRENLNNLVNPNQLFKNDDSQKE